MLVLTETQYAVLRWVKGDSEIAAIRKRSKVELAEALTRVQELGLVKRTPRFDYELTAVGEKLIGANHHD